MAKVGKIPMLTPEAHRIIVESVGQGSVYEIAAMRAGVTTRSVYKWLARGRKGGKANALYVQFVHALEKAKGDRALLSLARIGKAGQGGAVLQRVTKTTTNADGTTTTIVTEKLAQPEWTADAWLMDRLHAKFYASNNHETASLRKKLAELKKLVPAHETADAGGVEILGRLAALLAAKQSLAGGDPRPQSGLPEGTPVDSPPPADRGVSE